MNVQAQLDKEAIDMLPQTKSYIRSEAVSAQRASHHNYVVIQAILNRRFNDKAMIYMSAQELQKMDDDMLNYLKSLDTER